MSDLVERLRGVYKVPVDDKGQIIVNTDPGFKYRANIYWEAVIDPSIVPPIQKEAADEIEKLALENVKIANECGHLKREQARRDISLVAFLLRQDDCMETGCEHDTESDCIQHLVDEFNKEQSGGGE